MRGACSTHFSNAACERMWKVEASSVVTEAERGCLSIIDISPKKSPGPRIFRMISRPSSSPMKTFTLPDWIM